MPDIKEEDIESYVSGKCMYLAAALHRLYGWEIQVALEQDKNVSYIAHAWCAKPDGAHVDIDGVYDADKNGWIHPQSIVLKKLDESNLYDLTLNTSYQTFSRQDWNENVEKAIMMVHQYLEAQGLLSVSKSNKHTMAKK